MLKNVFAQKATWIQSQNTDYNYGRQQTFRVYASSTADYNGRALVQFPDSLTRQTYDSAILVLTNIQRRRQAVDQVVIDVYPLTRSWDQGIQYGDTGTRSYQNRSRARAWSSSGGDFTDSVSARITLTRVDDNLTADFSSFINYWSSSRNNGILIKYRDQSLYDTATKRFRSNYTNAQLYRPKVILSSSRDVIFDNSQNLYINQSYNIYYYNYVNGVLKDIDGTNSVFNTQLVGMSAVVSGSGATATTANTQIIVDTLTASRYDTGLYKASSTANLPASALLFTSSLSAKWSASGTLSAFIPAFYTQVQLIRVSGSALQTIDQLSLVLSNKKQYYKKNQKILLKPKLFKRSNVRDLQGSGTRIFVSQNMYFRVIDYRTKQIIYDWTKVGYTRAQNYIQLDLNNMFTSIDEDKYELVIQVKIQDIYNQTLRFGQSIFDNRMITIL